MYSNNIDVALLVKGAVIVVEIVGFLIENQDTQRFLLLQQQYRLVQTCYYW